MARLKGKKRSSRTRTESPALSAPFGQILNSYALAAGAAGVAILACSFPAESASVCRNISLQFLGTDTYSLNPANGPITPFNIAATFSSPSTHSTFAGGRVFLTPNLPGAEVVLGASDLPADLPKGADISPERKFGRGRSYGLLFSTEAFQPPRGNMKPGGVFNYFGYRFQVSGKNHYGWVRMTVVGNHRDFVTQIIDSGYETNPDTPIRAGACETREPKGTGAAPTGSATKVQAGSLGNLATGASGLSTRRTK